MLPILTEYRGTCSVLDQLLKEERYLALLSQEASCIGCCHDESLRGLFARFLQKALVKREIDPILVLEAARKSKSIYTKAIDASMRFNGVTGRLEWRHEHSSYCFNLDHVREAIAEYFSRKHATSWLNDEPVR